jgi:hypothetical protein
MEWPQYTKASNGDLFYVLYNKKETSFNGEIYLQPYTVAWFIKLLIRLAVQWQLQLYLTYLANSAFV